MSRKPSIAICTTNYGPIDSMVYQNHLALAANSSRTFDVKFIGCTDKMYTHTASNTLAENAVESDLDYVMFLENDMLLPCDTTTRLWEVIKRTDLDGVSGLYFLRGADGTQPCLYNRDENSENKFAFVPVLLVPENEVFTIDCPGMGCILLKTDVFRKVPHPWFDLAEGKYGQDIYFYSKCKDSGIKIGCDTSICCGHLGEKRVYNINDYKDALVSRKLDGKGGMVLTHPRNIVKKEALIGGKV